MFEIHANDITHTLGQENRETDEEKFLDSAVRTERSCQQRIHLTHKLIHSHTHTHTADYSVNVFKNTQALYPDVT